MMFSLLAAVVATGAAGEADTTEGIPAHRMGSFALRLCDQSGTPFADKEVTIRQIGHEFLFGYGPDADSAALSESNLDQLAGACNHVELVGNPGRTERIRVTTAARLLGMSVGYVSEETDTEDYEVRVLPASSGETLSPPGEVVRLSHELRKADPDAILVLGVFDVDLPGQAGKVAAYVRACLDAGADIDRVGCVVSATYDWATPAPLLAALGSLSETGKPLHVIGIPVSEAAEWLQRLMALKAVEGVVFTGSTENLQKGLIEPYATLQNARTDDDGRLVFTGSFGDYEVVLDGHVWKPRLVKGGPREFELRKPPTVEPPERFESPFTAQNATEAQLWQKRVRAGLLEIVSAQNPRTDNDLEVVAGKIERRGKYSIQDISFVGNEGQRIEATLTIPLGEGPFPAIVCLHGHGGTREKVHDHSTEFHGFATEFAKRGFVTIAPSLAHYDHAPNQLWNLMRLVDVLETLEPVDTDRIGVAGLSMGGEWTMWLAATDLRVEAAVVSGWMCTTEGVLSIHNCPCWMPPGLRELCDIAEVHILVAPRPLLFESAISDGCFPIRATEEGYRKVLRGYGVLGAPENVRQHTFPGGHAWNGGVAYEFMRRALGTENTE